MIWSGLLPIAVAAALAAPGSVSLGHASDGQRKGTLMMSGTAQGRAPFRQAQSDLDIEVPDVTDPDGTIESSGEGMSGFVTLAERPSRPAYVYALPVSCRVQAIVGSANTGTARVVLRLRDGSTRRLPLRRAPEGWHYAGHMIGTFVHTSSRIIGVRAYDARGHVLTGAQWQPDPTCP